MNKSIRSNPDTFTSFHYISGNTVHVTTRHNGIIELEETLTFDSSEEAQEYFKNLKN